MLIMNNIYNLDAIGQRIKKERIAHGFSQQELADKLNIAARQTIAKWEKGIAVPQLEDILNMCNLFECEIGYLLGEYDCKTRTSTDIVKETGLEEQSIAALHTILKNSTTSPDDVLDVKPARADITLRAINHILGNSNGRILLYYISMYLYGDFTHFYTDSIVDSEDLYYHISELGLWDSKHGIDEPFDIYKLNDVMLIEIQQELAKNRELIQSSNTDYKRITPVSHGAPLSTKQYISDLKEELAFLEELDKT